MQQLSIAPAGRRIGPLAVRMRGLSASPSLWRTGREWLPAGCLCHLRRKPIPPSTGRVLGCSACARTELPADAGELISWMFCGLPGSMPEVEAPAQVEGTAMNVTVGVDEGVIPAAAVAARAVPNSHMAPAARTTFER
jgi:hypothetical protein